MITNHTDEKKPACAGVSTDVCGAIDADLVNRLNVLLSKWMGRIREKQAEASNALPGSLSMLHIEASAAAYIKCYADISSEIGKLIRLPSSQEGLNKDGD